MNRLLACLEREQQLRILALEAERRGLAAGRPDLALRYEQYRHDPVEFARKVLRVTPWSLQGEMLERVRDHPRVSVRSCHGSGKSFTAAVCALWFTLTRSESIVITTAPTYRQVEQVLWREIRRLHWHSRLPGKCHALKFEPDHHNPLWYALGLSTDEPDRFQGFHARDLLLIVDEAAGVSETIFEAMRGVLTSAGARLLLIGNPTSSDGTFYDSHHARRDTWSTLAIPAAVTPHWTGEAVSSEAAGRLVTREWARDQELEYGTGHAIYQSRVLAEFPDQAEGSLMPLSWILAAAERDELPGWRAEPVEIGVDVARQGNCETVAIVRRGGNLLCLEAWRGQDLMESTGRVVKLAQRYEAASIKVDATGMGSGMVDRLQELKLPVLGVWVGNRPSQPEKYVMLRDELWWSLRERLREGLIWGVTDPRLQGQLSAIRSGVDSRGRIRIEDKATMSKRGLASPDRADACCLAFGEIHKRRWDWSVT